MIYIAIMRDKHRGGAGRHFFKSGKPLGVEAPAQGQPGSVATPTSTGLPKSTGAVITDAATMDVAITSVAAAAACSTMATCGC